MSLIKLPNIIEVLKGFRGPNSNRRSGSNIVALILGVILISFAIYSIVVKSNPLVGIPSYIIVSGSALAFGLVLLAWVRSDWTHWIGNETVNMVVGVIAALIAIIAFAHDIEKHNSEKAPATKSVRVTTPDPARTAGQNPN